MTLLLTILALAIGYVSGRYRKSRVMGELRKTLKDRTIDRNHWMSEAEKWEKAFWEEWNLAEREAAQRN